MSAAHNAQQDAENMLLQRLSDDEESLLLAQGIINAMRGRIEELERQNERLRRMHFGRRSEKVSKDQLLLAFAKAGLAPPTNVKATNEDGSNKRKRGKRRSRRRGKPLRDLPRRTTTYPAEATCPVCGGERHLVGHSTSETVEREPAKLYIRVHMREKRACRSCDGQFTLAPGPSKPTDGGRPGFSLLADLLEKKFDLHLPLYRIQKDYDKDGAWIPMPTLVRWVAAGADMLEPIAKRLLELAIQAGILHTDDTGVRVLDSGAPKGVKKGHLWVYLGDAQIAAFDYTPDWRAARPQELLKNRVGPLVADQYAGYDAVFSRPGSKAIEVGCNAHARRPFFEMLRADPRAAVMVAYYRELYDIEDEAKEQGLDHDGIRALRQQKATVVFAKIRKWIQETAPHAPPGTALGDAIRYVNRHWDALTRYLNDGRLPIDNLPAERELKRIGMGRRAWLFFGSDEAGRRAAILYSIVASCALNNIRAGPYLVDVLTRLANGHKARDLDALLPHNWRSAEEETDAHKLAA